MKRIQEFEAAVVAAPLDLFLMAQRQSSGNYLLKNISVLNLFKNQSFTRNLTLKGVAAQASPLLNIFNSSDASMLELTATGSLSIAGAFNTPEIFTTLISTTNLTLSSSALSFNHQSLGTENDWRLTLQRPATGMTAHAVITLPTASGTLLSSTNNLSDLGNINTARTNLGAASAVWNANKLQGSSITATSPSNAQGLFWNAANTELEWSTVLGALPNQAPSLVLSGPINGGSAPPTFRALLATDLPAIPSTQISGLGTIATQAASNVNLTGGSVTNLSAFSSTFPLTSIEGLVGSVNTTNPKGIDITAGQALVGSPIRKVTVSSSVITKDLNSSWATGNNAGGMFTGAIAANTTYHIFLIRNILNGSVDFGADLSFSGVNIPANYEGRRIFSIMTNSSSNIIPFSQEADEFLLLTPTIDVNSANLVTPALYRLTVPTGKKFRAHVTINGGASNNGAKCFMLVNPEDVNAVTPSLTNHDTVTGSDLAPTPVADYYNTTNKYVRTNINGQVRVVANIAQNGSNGIVITRGWLDNRILG